MQKHIIKVLKENHFIDKDFEPSVKEDKADLNSIENDENKKLDQKYKIRTKREAHEYKWACGQKIAIDNDWKMKQHAHGLGQRGRSYSKVAEDSQKNQNRKSLTFLCDMNGRLIPGGSEKSLIPMPKKLGGRDSSITSQAKKKKKTDMSKVYKSTPTKTQLQKNM